MTGTLYYKHNERKGMGLEYLSLASYLLFAILVCTTAVVCDMYDDTHLWPEPMPTRL